MTTLQSQTHVTRRIFLDKVNFRIKWRFQGRSTSKFKDVTFRSSEDDVPAIAIARFRDHASLNQQTDRFKMAGSSIRSKPIRIPILRPSSR